jgi:hypothetical protein
LIIVTPFGVPEFRSPVCKGNDVEWFSTIRMKQFSVGLLLLASLAAYSAINPVTAFDELKSLQGRWTIQSAGKTLPIQMTYEVASNGSIVTEQFGKELSVFYRDGSDLAMIHFCNAGNQPRLKLVKENDPPKVLTFETVEVTNLRDPEGAHVQRIIYTIIDSKTIKLEIVWKRGKSQESEDYTLNRA